MPNLKTLSIIDKCKKKIVINDIILKPKETIIPPKKTITKKITPTKQIKKAPIEKPIKSQNQNNDLLTKLENQIKKLDQSTEKIVKEKKEELVIPKIIKDLTRGTKSGHKIVDRLYKLSQKTPQGKPGTEA